MNLPLVSIGVPFFNSNETIEKVMHNLLNQNFENLEIILSDNCSTDNSYEKIKNFLLNNKVNYFKNDKNLGAIFNHNILLDYAKGKYFMWAHSDDLISENFIKEAVNILENDNKISSVIGKMIFIENGKIKKSYQEPKNLNQDKYNRIDSYITSKFSDSLMMGLHRKSVLVKQKFIMSPEIPFILNLLSKGKIEGCPKIKYFKYSEKQRSMKENIEHYKYVNLLTGRYAWYIVSILEILKSDLKNYEKIKLVFKFIIYNFPLLRKFFKKKDV